MVRELCAVLEVLLNEHDLVRIGLIFCDDLLSSTILCHLEHMNRLAEVKRHNTSSHVVNMLLAGRRLSDAATEAETRDRDKDHQRCSMARCRHHRSSFGRVLMRTTSLFAAQRMAAHLRPRGQTTTKRVS